MKSAVLALALGSTLATMAYGQATAVPATPANDTASAQELVADAVRHFKQQLEELVHFVSTVDGVTETTFTYANGKERVTHFSDHMESVVVEGKSYVRVIIRDGRPLTEQEVKEFNERSQAQDRTFKANYESGMSPTPPKWEELSTAAYTDRVVGHALVEGHDCLLLEAMPVTISKDRVPLGFRFWIDPATHAVLRNQSEHLADHDPGLRTDMTFSPLISLKGTSDTMTYRLVDGVWLPYEAVLVSLMRQKENQYRAVSRQVVTHTSYQRFTATSTIHPAP